MALRPVYFQHIQKTGGTSVSDTLRLFFPEKCIAPRQEDLFKGDHSITEALDGLRSFDFVTSHADILGSAPSDAFTFVLLREPLERLLSARRQFMQAGPENLVVQPQAVRDAFAAFQELPFSEVLSRLFEHPRLVSSFWNHQTLTLGVWPIIRQMSREQGCSAYEHKCLDVHFESGQALSDWLSRNKHLILERAINRLHTINYIGLTENIQTSACEIFARIGLPEPGQFVHRNARVSFGDEDDPKIREAATDLLELDRELYEIGSELHARQNRVARGMPVDYIRRRLTGSQTVTISCREPPGGHGWYPAHLRDDGTWARWTGPELESRFSLAVDPGSYRVRLDVYGAISERSFFEAEVFIDGRKLPIIFGSHSDHTLSISADFARENSERFDIVVRFPEVGQPYGLEVKQFVFSPSVVPNELMRPVVIGPRLITTVANDCGEAD